MFQEISGKVVTGDKYGRKLGFPTANLDTKATEISAGVYVGKVIINKKTYRAAIIVNEARRIEAYLFGYRGDAYGRMVTFKLKNFIREYKKFETEKELIIQIGKDLKAC